MVRHPHHELTDLFYLNPHFDVVVSVWYWFQEKRIKNQQAWTCSLDIAQMCWFGPCKAKCTAILVDVLVELTVDWERETVYENKSS